MLNRDGTHLRCATHGALFRFGDGYCVSGPCHGGYLTPVPVKTVDGAVSFM